MTFIRIFILTIIVASLSGCVLNEQTFNQARPELRKRPDIQADFTRRCERNVKYAHIEVKRDVAGFMRTDLDGLPQKVCSRFLKGYLSGKMRFEDFNLVMKRQRFTPNMVAILRTK